MRRILRREVHSPEHDELEKFVVPGLPIWICVGLTFVLGLYVGLIGLALFP